jgi:hypothetical protein
MNLEIMYTAAKIKAIQDPACLERVRQRRDAIPGAPHRSRLAWQVGVGLNRFVEPGKVPI